MEGLSSMNTTKIKWSCPATWIFLAVWREAEPWQSLGCHGFSDPFWHAVEETYIESLGDTKQGSKAYNVRLALGALIIKERLGLSDEDTVEAITENPYLQYFIGLHSFQQEASFHASSMTHFRTRFDVELINELNKSIVAAQRKNNKKKDDDHEPLVGK